MGAMHEGCAWTDLKHRVGRESECRPSGGGPVPNDNNPNTASAFGDAGFGELDLSLRGGGFTRVSVAPGWRTLTRRVSSRARTAMPLRYRSARRARQLPHPLAGGRHGYLSDCARRRL